MTDKEWAHRIIDEIPEDFYGKVEFEFRAGRVRGVAKSETFKAPDAEQQRQNAVARKIILDKTR